MPAPKLDKIKIAELWHQGCSVSRIADITGGKEDSIYKCAHRMKLPKRRSGKASILSDREKEKWFIRNYPEMSNSTMAVYLGLSSDYIGVLGRKLGLKKSESYWQGVKEYHRKRMKQFHATKKGDKEYYKYNIRPRKNGKFIKSKD